MSKLTELITNVENEASNIKTVVLNDYGWIRTTIAANPLYSVGAAWGVGAVMALIFAAIVF